MPLHANWLSVYLFEWNLLHEADCRKANQLIANVFFWGHFHDFWPSKYTNSIWLFDTLRLEDEEKSTWSIWIWKSYNKHDWGGEIDVEWSSIKPLLRSNAKSKRLAKLIWTRHVCWSRLDTWYGLWYICCVLWMLANWRLDQWRWTVKTRGWVNNHGCDTCRCRVTRNKSELYQANRS